MSPTDDTKQVTTTMGEYRLQIDGRAQPAFDRLLADMQRHENTAEKAPERSGEFLALFSALLEQQVRLQEVQSELTRMRRRLDGCFDASDGDN